MPRTNCGLPSPLLACKPIILTHLISPRRRASVLLRSRKGWPAPSICLNNCSRWRDMRPPPPARRPWCHSYRTVMDLVADLLPEAARKGVDLGFELIEPVATKGEPVIIAKMVRNLIDNAVRFTPAGGRVDIGVYREGSEAVLQIEDTGPGIPPDDIDRIFEPFFRGSRPTEDGTGLGLSIVKRIVDRLGGSVVLENMSGPALTGLRAIVRLPAARIAGPSIRTHATG